MYLLQQKRVFFKTDIDWKYGFVHCFISVSGTSEILQLRVIIPKDALYARFTIFYNIYYAIV